MDLPACVGRDPDSVLARREERWPPFRGAFVGIGRWSQFAQSALEIRDHKADLCWCAASSGALYAAQLRALADALCAG
ncbi:hypothetical protein [Variovorax sp. OK605]|uniref:hypothetical protein n=1 Tax=Variovorax sp. OK605 TaxID=1855317 RepID=UPI00116075AC|nr:hypothetical protein [Variovorax sp. OK605]